jgi:hypothetical protein
VRSALVLCILVACGAHRTPLSATVRLKDQTPVELRLDPHGALLAGDRRIGRIDGSRVLNRDGQVVMEIRSDGRITSPLSTNATHPFRILADGSLALDDGTRAVIDDRGAVQVPGDEALVVRGFQRGHEREAWLLVTLALDVAVTEVVMRGLAGHK